MVIIGDMMNFSGVSFEFIQELIEEAKLSIEQNGNKEELEAFIKNANRELEIRTNSSNNG